MIRILGVDCAVQAVRVGLACGIFDAGQLIVQHATPGSPDGVVPQLKAWIDPDLPTLLAIDAPLGWPALLGTALAGHRAGQVLPDEANQLFRRTTDLAIRTIKQPLDTGADRIARTAHQALKILAELAGELGQPEIPLAWSPQLSRGVWAIEVHPAATLPPRKGGI
jgi:predicted RNase H-like nuclease